MRYFELVEAREDFIADKMGDRIMLAYQADTGTKPEYTEPLPVINHLMQASPKAAQWLANEYADGNYKLEDINQIKADLALFTKAKAKIPANQRDLNKLSLSTLRSVIAPFENQDLSSNKQKNKKMKNSFFDEDKAKLFYKSPTMIVIIPKTKEASCYFGKGTKWCTAGTKSKNHFDEYNKKGPLYVTIIKGAGKFQFQFESHSFHNAANEAVNVGDLAVNYPELITAFDKIAKKHNCIPFIDGAAPVTKYIRGTPESLQYIREQYQSEEMCMDAIKEDPYALHYISRSILNQQMCDLGISYETELISIIPEEFQTEKLCLQSITNGDGAHLQFIKNQTPEMCAVAVTISPDSIQYVKNPTLELLQYSVIADYESLAVIKPEYKTPKLCALAVACDEDAIQYVDKEMITPKFETLVKRTKSDYDEDTVADKILKPFGRSMDD